MIQSIKTIIRFIRESIQAAKDFELDFQAKKEHVNKSNALAAIEKTGYKNTPLYLNNTGKVGFYINTKHNGFLWLNVEDIPMLDDMGYVGDLEK